MGAVLRAVTLPPAGGDTIWVDGHLAFESLDSDLKEQLRKLYIIHDFQFALKPAGINYPIVAHPAVHIHPRSGEEILWVNYSHNPSVLGLSRDDSNRILTKISDAYRKPEHQVRVHWAPGTVIFWDNRATVHYGVANYGAEPRLLERVLIEEPDQSMRKF